MKRTLTRWIKATPLVRPMAEWVWRRVAPAPPPELPENANEMLYAFMRRVLNESSNCIDIGASFGGYLEQMIAISPRGLHHAFEPIPALAEDLKSRFPSARVHAMALADRTGVASFHYFPDVSPFSGLKRRSDVAHDERTQVIDVPVAPLDDVIPSDLPIALVKIDVEGAELDVIRGARNTITRCRPFLIIEHDTGPAAQYGATSETLYALVSEKLGYSLTTCVRALADAAPFTRDEFLATVRDGAIYNFVAIPRT
jgi:FkbM family methyltransferase